MGNRVFDLVKFFGDATTEGVGGAIITLIVLCLLPLFLLAGLIYAVVDAVICFVRIILYLVGAREDLPR